MNATAAERATGEQKVLCTYECDEGVRQLVGRGRPAAGDGPDRARLSVAFPRSA
jgi:hypothetical protein